jgi:hypothetical protein
MPAYGQPYEFPDREIMMGDGTHKPMKFVLTDTPACGTIRGEEQPLCTAVTPNSTQHCNAIPSWMRIMMRGMIPHYAVLFVIDATAVPLWEDERRCRDLARLLSVLKRNQYTVVIAVTKLLKLRQDAQTKVNHGEDHGGAVGKNPRSCYESFVSGYLGKVVSSIQAKALEENWSMSQGPDCPAFPMVNSTIFDVPTWANAGDFKSLQERKGASEVPNKRYIHQQLERLLVAVSRRSHE